MKDIISALNLAQSLARQIDAKEVSAIERDLALEKLRNIYDLLLGVAVPPEVQEPLAESVIELIEELVDEVEEFDNEEEEPTEEPAKASAEEEVAEVDPTEEPEVELAEEPAEDEPQEELEDSVIELIEDLVEEVEVFDNDEEVEEPKAETEPKPEPEPAVEAEAEAQVRAKTKLAHSAILALYDDDEEDDVNDAPAEVDEVDVAEEEAVEEQENEVVIDMTELVPPLTEPENEEGESAEPEVATAAETVEPAASEPVEVEPKVAATEPAKVVLGEVLGADQPTLADRIAADAPADVASLANAQKSLVEMIGLNDKFILLRDLFHNNHDYYEAAIDQLDEFESIDEAMLFIHDNFQWNPNSEGAKLMVELLTNKLL